MEIGISPNLVRCDRLQWDPIQGLRLVSKVRIRWMPFLVGRKK
jgi:hypothetical protein